MENIRTKYYYEDPVSFENRGSKGKYKDQNLRPAKNSNERISSQEVINELCNAFIKDKLLSGKKELLFNEGNILYSFITKIDNETLKTIVIDIPTGIKDSIYCQLVRDDIEKLDRLTQLGKKEEKTNRINKILAALIGLGIALGTAYSFKTAIDYEKEEHANTGDKLRSEYSFMDDSEYEEMIQKGKEIWKINQIATSKTYTKK